MSVHILADSLIVVDADPAEKSNPDGNRTTKEVVRCLIYFTV